MFGIFVLDFVLQMIFVHIERYDLIILGAESWRKSVHETKENDQ